MENIILKKEEEFKTIKSGCNVTITLKKPIIENNYNPSGKVVDNKQNELHLLNIENEDITIKYEQIKEIIINNNDNRM